MNSITRIMLVEDHPKYRKVIEMVLKEEADMEIFEVFGAAEIALSSVQGLAPELHPNIILLDLNLPGIGGLEALPLFKACLPETNIIVLTQSEAEEDVLTAIQEGASGYLLKSSTVSQIKEGIRTVIDGGSTLDGSIARLILSRVKKYTPKTNPIETPLSNREIEILTLVAEGLVKKEIADQLGIGYGSVATYIRRIYEKLNVVNAPAAVAKGFQTGILPPKS